MRKILITGENSYIGNSFKSWVEENYSAEMKVNTVGMKNGEWENISFEEYDTVLHVAGIAHVSKKKSMKRKYYEINTDLTIKVAKKAKKEGVKHFIFLSSIIVYGKKGIKDNGIITEKTIPIPKDYYGDSKLLAEKKLRNIEDHLFNVSLIRPPMVYGKGSKGNYFKLSNLASKINWFPYVENQRSMIYIDNLSDFLCFVVARKNGGTYFPQNSEYVNTSDLVKKISEKNGGQLELFMGFDKVLRYFSRYNSTLKKLFGNLVYDQKMSDYGYDYRKISFEDSIERTEGR